MNHDRFLFSEQWANIDIKNHHGCIVPLFSIYSESSCGIGEILDLIPLITWLSECSGSILQLLPINDTGDDPSPYMGLSACALHPIYLSLHALPGIQSLDLFQKLTPSFQKLRKETRVSYHTVLQKKLSILQAYFKSIDGQKILHSPSYLHFIEKEKAWLQPYALYKSLKEHNQKKAWWDFKKYSKRPKSVEEALITDSMLHDDLHFWMGIQFLLFHQWEQVHQIATDKKVHLIGDLPILINKDSADVWWHPELFSFDATVGAPPDMYAADGQNWGFPLYNWETIRKDQFRWIQQRLHVQEKLYSAFRIDHIVGLYRFWAIPPGKKAKEGFFIPENHHEWIRQGEELITMIASSTTMLPIGEDLGDIPDSVRASMRALGVPGTKVLRWEKDWHSSNPALKPFLNPYFFSPESVSMIGTHDSSTLEGWWSEDPTSSQQFCREMGIFWSEKLSQETRFKILQLCHSSSSLFHMNLIQEYIATVPELSWNDPDRERVNVPGTVTTNNWTGRLKIPLEVLTTNIDLKKNIYNIFQGN